MDISTWDATTWASVWATISLLIFIGITIYAGVPRMIGKALDKRIAQIQDDLAEAARLRKEAEDLLAEYEAKRVSAEAEAAGIVTAAQEEAKRLAVESAASLEDLIARRTRTVEQKIAQAEAQAVAEVRARSADIAIEAARVVLANQMTEKGDAVVERSIQEVGSKLN
jgi:F-type H+-transporting ATPase subunit b